MLYKNLVLLGLGMMGILLHNLMKIRNLKLEGKEFNFAKYYSDEWPTVSISLCMVIIAIYLKHEIKELEVAGNYLGFGFVTIGYMGQSILVSFMSKAGKKIGIDDSTKAVLLLVGSMLLLSGCANEKKFVRYHSLNEAKALEHILRWYPNKDSVVERLTVVPGKPDTIPGEVIYANCDSAYIAALDEAAKKGVKVVVKRVAVPCPPSTAVHDTLYKDKSVYVTNTARERAAQLAVEAAQGKERSAVTSMQQWRKGAIVEGGLLGLVLVFTALRVYFRGVA